MLAKIQTASFPRPSGPPAQVSSIGFRLSSFRRKPAFTLIEMLVVIAIIAILMAAIVAVGSSVRAAASRRSTLTTLHLLQNLMKDYLAAGNPEPTVPTTWPYTLPGGQFAPTAPTSDPYNWILAFKSVPEISQKLDHLQFDNDAGGIPPAGIHPAILDAYGNPIRYVPSTTNNSPAGTNNPPGTPKEGYFMSAGPDGKFSTMIDANGNPPSPPLRADEIYSYDPTQ